jgi:hypothetical protein
MAASSGPRLVLLRNPSLRFAVADGYGQAPEEWGREVVRPC